MLDSVVEKLTTVDGLRPNRGATPDEIRGAERRLGRSIPPEFQRLLTVMNGSVGSTPAEGSWVTLWEVQRWQRVGELAPASRYPDAVIFADYCDESWWYAFESRPDGVTAIFTISGPDGVVAESLVDFLEAVLHDDPVIYGPSSPRATLHPPTPDAGGLHMRLRMKTVADPGVRRTLEERLARLRPDTPRRWGTLTAHEMLCHLGDAAEMVLRTRPRRSPIPLRARPIVKAIGLWSPLPWPHGIRTNPMHDPKADGTRPSEFARDRSRVLAGIAGIGAASGELEPVHGIFGTMAVRDWQRWTYRHTHHHLRQFGL